ncbi:MAG: hypothetical protein ABSF16_10525 [Terracidiphilus sp.]|jgi:hypothetical protein
MGIVSIEDGRRMAFQIKIRYDGDVPGVAEHRLSLAAFGEPLTQLLAALRRIATQMVTQAVEPERPSSGRFANLARQLDIEITSIEGGSAGFDGVVSFVQPPDELPLFADIAERASFALLDSIDRESKGQATNWAVRNYLSMLPAGITRQTYDLFENGTSRKRVEIGSVALMEVPEEFPFLREIDGHIVGVGFEPGRPEVRVKGDTTTASFGASAEQVEAALTIRRDAVRALGVHAGKQTRLLRIRRSSEPRFMVTDAAIEEHIFNRWAGVFARLAQ